MVQAVKSSVTKIDKKIKDEKQMFRRQGNSTDPRQTTKMFFNKKLY